jgi:hypothetical protein
MFCSNCGAQATGNFCANCGFPLQGQAPISDMPRQDWSDEVRYELLIQIPEVRGQISKAATAKRKRMSAEDFLEAANKVIPTGLPIKAVVEVVMPIFEHLGVKTGKTHSETLREPPGTVIVRALCSFASQGQEIRRVQQFEDGCLLEATIPSDMWSFEGSLFAAIRKGDLGTRVEAATNIKGQLYDWGKSQRCLQTLFLGLKGAD